MLEAIDSSAECSAAGANASATVRWEDPVECSALTNSECSACENVYNAAAPTADDEATCPLTDRFLRCVLEMQDRPCANRAECEATQQTRGQPAGTTITSTSQERLFADADLDTATLPPASLFVGPDGGTQTPTATQASTSRGWQAPANITPERTDHMMDHCIGDESPLPGEGLTRRDFGMR